MELGVGAGGIGVVAEHQPEVRRTLAVDLVKGVADVRLVGGGGAGITNGPDAHGLDGAGTRRGDERELGSGRREPLVRFRADGVEVARVGLEPRELDDVFREAAGVLDAIGGGLGRKSPADEALAGFVRPPADDHGAVRGQLQVGAPLELLGVRPSGCGTTGTGQEGCDVRDSSVG